MTPLFYKPFNTDHFVAIILAIVTMLAPGWSNAMQADRFETVTLDGQSYAFDPLSLDKPHLLVFWATWCQECRYEFHPLKALHQDSADTLNIVGISIDEDADEAAQMASDAGLPYLNIWDKKARIAKQFGVKGTPTLVLVDQNGAVRHVGHRLNSALQQQISALAE